MHDGGYGGPREYLLPLPHADRPGPESVLGGKRRIAPPGRGLRAAYAMFMRLLAIR